MCDVCETHKAFESENAISSFPLSAVRLLDSPFLRAQELNKQYLLTLDADRLLAPYLIEAGLEPRAERYTNWENTGLDGHIGGHYVSALSYMYASTGDEAIGRRLGYMIGELKRAQDRSGDGYLSGVPGGRQVWEEIRRGDIRASGFGLNDRWVPLYNIHKIFAGLRDAWLLTGNETALGMLTDLTDWMYSLVEGLSDEQMQDMLRSEHGGLNETFADVAAITGDSKYLDLARRFSHRAILEPLTCCEDRLTGMHANTQIPKVIGFKRISELDGDEVWLGAADYFWHTVTHDRSVAIGGNSAYEHFNPTDDFSVMISSEQGPETCNTYNMLRLSAMLHRTRPDAAYMDYYERALYNHILSTQNPSTGGLVYFTPMRPGHYRVYSQPHTSMWCCVGSGIENHSKYGEMIYSHDDRGLWVNLFIPSVVTWRERGLTLRQENEFPDRAATRLTAEKAPDGEMDIRIRKPGWTADMTVTVNGSPVSATAGEDGYVSVRRRWRPGDTVEVELPMEVRLEAFPDGSDYRAVNYGPVVLASPAGTADMTGLFADDSRGGHIAHGPKIPLHKLPWITGDDVPVRRTGGQGLRFAMKTSAGEVELLPFYELHESRYIIYWPTFESGYDEDEALEAATIDVIYCGQQQSESDHGFKGEDTQTGYTHGRHWRMSGGWISYDLAGGSGAGSLLITFLSGGDGGGCFTTEINGIVHTEAAPYGNSDSEWETIEYTLTEEMKADNGGFKIKITPHESHKSPMISVIRLL
ncbi:MAG: glycoside hydrolase family 127 protein [Alistipes sp.]|nr:glycoside hydrolase family 127 protein [Alistipes sp.]